MKVLKITNKKVLNAFPAKDNFVDNADYMEIDFDIKKITFVNEREHKLKRYTLSWEFMGMLEEILNKF